MVLSGCYTVLRGPAVLSPEPRATRSTDTAVQVRDADREYEGRLGRLDDGYTESRYDGYGSGYPVLGYNSRYGLYGFGSPFANRGRPAKQNIGVDGHGGARGEYFDLCGGNFG